MPWLRLDDRFTKHPKVLKLKRADRWTWLEILEYCAAYQTGGHVPDAIQDVVPHATPALIQTFVQARLLDDEQGGHHVHDWDVYNPKDPTKADRQARWRAKRREPVDTPVDTPVDDAVDAPVDKNETARVDAAVVAPRVAARARPVPVPITPSPNPFPEDDDKLKPHLHGIPLTGPARTIAHELLTTDPARLAACVTAATKADRPGGYLAELLRNGSHPEPPRPQPPRADPTIVCPDCGEKLGYGHLETCPRLAAVAEPDYPDTGQPAARAHEAAPEPVVELDDQDPEPIVGEART